MSDVTFLARNRIEESSLLRVFDRETGLLCDTAEKPSDAAVAVLMTMEHEEGCQFRISFAWPAHVQLSTTHARLAQIIADDFRTEILFESEISVCNTPAEEWVLATPGGIHACTGRISAYEITLCRFGLKTK
jgi:hypothetical protein